MATDMRKVGLGALLLLASSAIILGTGPIGSEVPNALAAVAALGMSAGALLLGTSEGGRPV